MSGNQGSAGPLPKSPAKSPGRKGGRPVTWVGGGGLSYQSVAHKGVPELRAIFFQVFGHPTASNNSTWLRRKLSEPLDESVGRGRSAMIRKRDQKAAIWTASKGGCSNKENANKTFNRSDMTGANSVPSPRKRKSCDGMSESSSHADSTNHVDLMALRNARRKVSDTGSVDSFEITRKQDPALATIIATLKHLTGPGFGPEGPSTVEVFWPALLGGEGGSWWPAKVVKVLPRKGKCRVLYDTSESEELDLISILEAKHLRLVKCPFPEVEAVQAPNAQNVEGGPQQETLALVPKAIQATASKILIQTQLSTALESNDVTSADENDAEHQALDDLQGIMQDPVDCSSLPCLSPETVTKDGDAERDEWLTEVDLLRMSTQASYESSLRDKLECDKPEEVLSVCLSDEASSVESYMIDPVSKSVLSFTDEPFSPNGSINQPPEDADLDDSFNSQIPLSFDLVPASTSVTETVAGDIFHHAEVSPSPSMSQLQINEQAQALQQRICQTIINMQVEQAAYQAAHTGFVPALSIPIGGFLCPGTHFAVPTVPPQQHEPCLANFIGTEGPRYPIQPVVAAEIARQTADFGSLGQSSSTAVSPTM